MTDYNYKQLCAELLRAMDELEECEVVDWSLVKTQPLKMASQSMAEVRAALDEPDPDVPTDEELDSLERQCWVDTGVQTDSTHEYLFDHRRYAHIILSRWGK